MHSRLRAATRDLHARVERLSPFGARLDRDAYVRYVVLRFGFEDAMERALAPFTELERMGVPKLDGAALLHADAEALGASRATLALARWERAPELGSLERALGCAYVLWGARLGGLAVVPCVRATLALADAGTRFFAAGDRASFEATLSVIERHVRHGEHEREVVLGARSCFASLARWLDRG